MICKIFLIYNFKKSSQYFDSGKIFKSRTSSEIAVANLAASYFERSISLAFPTILQLANSVLGAMKSFL